MRISDWSSDVCSSDLRSAPSGWPNCRLRSGGGARRDRLGERHRVAGAAQVRGQRILGFERGDDGLAQLRGLFSHAQVVEHLRRAQQQRSEEHTSELQSLMRISYAVFCLKKKKQQLYKTLQSSRYRTHHASHTADSK